jgi:minor histocompatibility antigen H13
MVLGVLCAVGVKDFRRYAMQAYGALWAILGVGMLPAMRSHSIVDLPYFIGLAVVTIYVGAHRGLNSKQRQTISIEQVQRWSS